MNAFHTFLCQAGVMSVDVFFQGFSAGQSSGHGGLEMREVLEPHVAESDGSFPRIQVGDGEADIYLRDDGMMANHISGVGPWDLLVNAGPNSVSIRLREADLDKPVV